MIFFSLRVEYRSKLVLSCTNKHLLQGSSGSVLHDFNDDVWENDQDQLQNHHV